jgi:ribosomal RNA-processing protein 36
MLPIAAKKDLKLKARHDFLAETGGRLAVRKAIDKKQKKTNQKEKKRRPAFAGRSDGIPTGRTGPRPGHERPNKRQKFE